MKFEELPEHLRVTIESLKHGSATIQADVNDALDSAQDIKDFQDRVSTAMDDLIQEAMLVRTGLGRENIPRYRPLSKMALGELLSRLFDILNDLHGGSYDHRFKEIAIERGRPQIDSSHFSKLDSASIQLLIETIEKLRNQKVNIISRTVEGLVDKENKVFVVTHLHKGLLYDTAVFGDKQMAEKLQAERIIESYGELINPDDQDGGEDVIDVQECQVIK